MTDYFALLEEPRRPWLDPDQLKQNYHRLTLSIHPDTRPNATPGNEFTELNKAYRTLSDPRQRLLYLLTSEGQAPSANPQTVPNDVSDLFFEVGSLNQQIDSFAKKQVEASTELARSLLTPDLVEIRTRLQDQLDRLRRLHNQQLAELQKLNDTWTADRVQTLSRVAEIYSRITYLSRWIEQLEEKRVRLSLA